MFNRDGMQDMKKPLAVMGFGIVILFIIELVYIANFNREQRTLTGYLESSGVSMAIHGRGGDTDSWLKRGFDLGGQKTDLRGTVYDVDLNNDSEFQIEGWALRMDITCDCFLNQAWCGTVEIHQSVSEGERVQTLDLRNMTADMLEIEYFKDSEILIPLHAGDYIVYRPSFKDGEMPINAGTRLTPGFIMYFDASRPEPEFNSYTASYNFHRTLLDGNNVYLLGGLLAIWLIMLLSYIFSMRAYKQAMKEMALRKSGIMSMSELYAVIYIIDLENGVLTPVVEDAAVEAMRPKQEDMSGQLGALVDGGCTEQYMAVAREFYSPDTLDERLADKNTVMLEYVSKHYGWCQARFLVMERSYDGHLEKVLFTVQIIDAEKKEMERIEDKVSQAQRENKAKSTFLANMSHEIRTPINTIIGLNTMILRENKNPVVAAYARSVHTASHTLMSVINSVLDMSKIEAGRMELQMEEYSLRELVWEVYNMHSSRAEFEQLDFSCHIDPRLPSRLYGDAVRIKQVIINLLANAVKFTEKGSIRLSVFGKMHDAGKVHLLFSVKDTGIGIRKEDLPLLTRRFAEADPRRRHALDGTGIGLDLSNGILALMDSELHVVSRYGRGSEFYFEIEQDLIDASPVGDLDFVSEEPIVVDEYRALFRAPEAKVLVVDDNAMDRIVFEELLQETGIRVDTAASGAVALEKTREQHYDIIFTDQIMPAMNGSEVVMAVRSQEGGLNRETPVIMLSANSAEDADCEWYEAKADIVEFMTKPIQPDLLERRLMQYLPPEKVEKNAGIAEAGGDGSERRLPNISGVDVAFGLNHTGSMRGYISVLEQFVRLGQDDREELDGYIKALATNLEDREALDSFRIKIRAMKATLHMMGAFRAYGVSAMLENATVHGNRQEVIDVAPYFMEEWERLRKDVEAVLLDRETIAIVHEKA